MAKTRVFKIFRQEGAIRARDQHGRYDFTLPAEAAEHLDGEDEVFVNATPHPTTLDIHGRVRRREW